MEIFQYVDENEIAEDAFSRKLMSRLFCLLLHRPSNLFIHRFHVGLIIRGSIACTSNSPNMQVSCWPTARSHRLETPVILVNRLIPLRHTNNHTSRTCRFWSSTAEIFELASSSHRLMRQPKREQSQYWPPELICVYLILLLVKDVIGFHRYVCQIADTNSRFFF